MKVVVEGSGIAASCCTRLLQMRGILPVLAPRQQSARGPVLLLNKGTQGLLGDIFNVESNELLADAWPIDRRYVRWGDRPTMALPHTGVVVDEGSLLDILTERFDVNCKAENDATEPNWTVVAGSQGGLRARTVLQFGARTAAVASVSLRQENAQSCWIESLERGWLFLLVRSEGSASLIAVGGTPEELLGQSSLVASEVSQINSLQGSFAAHPRIADPLCGTNWLACGTAAMGFDPICGEGAGNAMREAILACAVIGAADREDRAALTSFYSSRLLLGFLRHLEICLSFYRAARCSTWWDDQIRALEAGVVWVRSRLAVLPASTHFKLIGFELERLWNSPPAAPAGAFSNASTE